jgi:hypothetical protein
LSNTKKKHHYLPESYLKGFTDSSSGILWVYLKCYSEVRQSSPGNEGYQKYYYAFFDTGGKRHTNTIEDFFSKIEGNYIRVLNKIHDRKNLSSQDRINLAKFVAFIQTRVPWFRSEIDKMAAEHITNVGLEEAKRNFASSLETMGKIIGFEPKVQDNDYQKLMSPRGSIFSLAQTFDAANNFYKQLLGLKWRFLFSSTSIKYVTSDNPIYYYSENDQVTTIQGDSIIGENIEVTMPLSKKVALVAKRKNIQAGYGDATGTSIKSINKRTVLGAKENIYTSFNDGTFMKFVHKYKDSRPYMAMVRRKMAHHK